MDLMYSRILGSLIGVALGDAMGMPSEMWSRQRIENYFGKIADFLPGPDENAISKGLSAGEVTDDTIVTVLMAESIIEADGKIEPQYIVRNIENWAKSNEKSKFVIGPSTRQAFERIANGTPIEEAGKFGETNGASMRISPVGIISDYKNLDELIDNVVLACMPTHNTSVAISGAAAIAAAVSYCIHGGKDLEQMIDIAKKASKMGSSRGYDVCGPSMAARIDLGISLVRNGKNEIEILHSLYDVLGTSIASTESVPAALALTYFAKGDPVKCSLYAANTGGDTDTIGAMACGICGAMAGIEAFPERIVAKLSEVNKIPFENLAGTLLNLKRKRL